MITVLFFGQLKETLEAASVQISTENSGNTVADLRQFLIQHHGMTALLSDTIRFACNQTFCDEKDIIQAGDEIAFMPPMTGG
jgi:molybdopterin synthase sulfur carrier subunit